MSKWINTLGSKEQEILDVKPYNWLSLNIELLYATCGFDDRDRVYVVGGRVSPRDTAGTHPVV